MAIRIVILSLNFLAVLYGGFVFLKGFKNECFSIGFYAVCALLLFRVYNLGVYLAGGESEILTVGTLGETAAFLLFFAIDIRLFGYQFLKQEKAVGYLFPLVSSLALAAAFILPLIKNHEGVAIIRATILSLGIGVPFYGYSSIILKAKGDLKIRAMAPFNGAILILALLLGIHELTDAFLGEGGIDIANWVITILESFLLLLLLPLLKRGLEK